MKHQVIICQKNGCVVSNQISDYVPELDSNILIERHMYRVDSKPITIVRSKPSENLLKDAAIIVAQNCKDELSYLRQLTPEHLRVPDWTGQHTIEPDLVTIVSVRFHAPANLFNEVEAALAAKLADQK